MDREINVATAVYQHLLDEDLHVEARNYIWRRRQEIKKHIEALQLEEKALVYVQEVMERDLCDDCKGQKKFRQYTSPDESYLATCSTCNGSGRKEKESTNGKS